MEQPRRDKRKRVTKLAAAKATLDRRLTSRLELSRPRARRLLGDHDPADTVAVIVIIASVAMVYLPAVARIPTCTTTVVDAGNPAARFRALGRAAIHRPFIGLGVAIAADDAEQVRPRLSSWNGE